jgi:hypothetical protein
LKDCWASKASIIDDQCLPPIEAPVVNRSGKLISDLIVEMRGADE